MPANYVLLEKITVGAAGASSVTFSGIPQTGYTDLVIKFSGRSARGGAYEDSLKIQFNGDTGSNYSSRILQQYNNAVSSAAETSVGYATIYSALDGASATANTFSNGEIYIPNYTSSNAKSFSIDAVSETNGTQGSDDMSANLWTGTAAISSITLFPYFSTFVQYTTFYLYGVAKLGTTPAIVPYATGGDTIMTDGTYWYHTFLSSGTFTPAKGLTCDYLVVAGGGGGSDDFGAGGGAGGLRSTVTATGGGGSLESALSLASGTGYTVTIGAGGTGGSGNSARGTSGSNSVFSTITSTGGGAAGVFGAGLSAGLTGGSGGGGAFNSAANAAGTANQGYAGGRGYEQGGTNTRSASGGGGGAGAVGGNGADLVAGNGGAGVAVSISGSSVTYAGGGGASGGTDITTVGTGGSGGGGNGGSTGNAGNGTANTGGGGGGNGKGSAAGTGGNGGSGIVIVRYAV